MDTILNRQMQQKQSGQPEDGGLVLIKGETDDGKKFRPSDWCDRLHSTLQALDPDEYLECVEYVHLVNSNVGRGILVDSMLGEVNPMLFKFLMGFVSSNHLATDDFTKERWEKLKNGD